jgi:hypothetical protein
MARNQDLSAPSTFRRKLGWTWFGGNREVAAQHSDLVILRGTKAGSSGNGVDDLRRGLQGNS